MPRTIYKCFLSELACNSPGYGLLQLEGNQDVLDYEVLHQLASTDLSIQDTTCHYQLCLLQTHAPTADDFVSILLCVQKGRVNYHPTFC